MKIDEIMFIRVLKGRNMRADINSASCKCELSNSGGFGVVFKI